MGTTRLRAGASRSPFAALAAVAGGCGSSDSDTPSSGANSSASANTIPVGILHSFLSGGEAQQLAIARTLTTCPRLLLLDEPSEGIQPSIILEIEDAIAELKRDGMSILLVEQYVDFAMRLADPYAVMGVGRIVAAGPTATFERHRMQQLMSV